ncbi:hypothetical protein [Stenotrophomonas sp. Iso1]|uniref:hypothetical protein n=1 Tax=Stenotrophomonas sp. Iso1 TaxID=2977283 RepID=UPI0022B7D0EF|nr:hypothetical protein [Stenotrophomonas sp. Iso1]
MASRRSVAGWLTVVFILGQLAILGIKELREQGSPLAQQYAFFGYAPNLVAAATLPWLVLAVALKRGGPLDGPYAWRDLWHEGRALCAGLLLSTGGLLAWEFIQRSRPNRTFDWQDIWATMGGTGLCMAVIVSARLFTMCRANSSSSTRA